DVEGALWQSGQIDESRIRDKSPLEMAEECERIVVAVDPAGTSLKRSDETGIIVIGLLDKEVYVLEDASGKYSPDEWARKALGLKEKYQADNLVAENNYGGEMVESTLNKVDDTAPRPKIVNSRRGKFIRAEPVHALYEQGRVH